ncbi:MAG: DNA polymerase [Patescibacteria group bacterium]
MKKEAKESRKKLVLLDAHAIIHRAYHALPEFSTSKGQPTGGLYGVSAMLIKIINELKPDYIVACYDLPKPTFRHEVYKDYKAGRAKAEEDLISQIIESRKIFEAFNIPIYEKEGFEADDILGTIVEELSAKDGKDTDIIIASGDMDTLQLVSGKKVRVYTLKKGINDTIIYDEDGVKERFGFFPELLPDYKGLKGDPSDNIIGIKGIGDKTAVELIKNFGSIENIYKKLKKDKGAFEKAGFSPRIIKLLEDGEEEAVFSKVLATIRRDAPIDFKLPEKNFMDSMEPQKIENLFTEFEFRSLLQRVKSAFPQKYAEDSLATEKTNTTGPEEINKIGIALWLLDSNFINPEPEDILRFGKTDSFAKAKEKILNEIKRQGLEKIYYEMELPLIPVVREAETRGILVDTKYLKELSGKYHESLEKTEANIWKAAGENFNINSPKQLGEIIFDKLKLSVKGLKKTAGGARSTRESELGKLRGEHKVIDEILSYRELQKLLSTYIDNIPAMVDEEGRLHTKLNQAGTTTGRFSSSSPNLQNIPVREGLGAAVRNAFVAGKGFHLVSFDYSQIEMRILAIASGDKNLIEAFKSGHDIHTSVAAKVFGVSEKDITKEMRRKAKIINFGIIYGMGVSALRANLGGTRAEAQEFYDNYFKKMPKIASYFEKVKKEAGECGFTETLFGRKRHFESIKSRIDYIRAQAERMALNAPLQGTAADIIKISMVKVDKKLKEAKLDDKVFLILQIHDELLYEVKDEAMDEAQKIIKETMEDFKDLGVPIVVNVSRGLRWGEME